MLKRKLVSAALSSIFLSIILPFILSWLSLEFFINQSKLSEVSGGILVFLLYSYPVLLVYGTLTSLLSEKTASFIAKKANNERLLFWVSGSLHLFFGLIVLLYGVLGASIFFLIDTILYKKFTNLRWYIVMLIVFLPVILFFALAVLV